MTWIVMIACAPGLVCGLGKTTWESKRRYQTEEHCVEIGKTVLKMSALDPALFIVRCRPGIIAEE